MRSLLKQDTAINQAGSRHFAVAGHRWRGAVRRRAAATSRTASCPPVGEGTHLNVHATLRHSRRSQECTCGARCAHCLSTKRQAYWTRLECLRKAIGYVLAPMLLSTLSGYLPVLLFQELQVRLTLATTHTGRDGRPKPQSACQAGWLARSSQPVVRPVDPADHAGGLRER